MQKSQGVSIDNVFSCSLYHGIVPADSSIRLKFAFRPELINIAFVDHFEIYSIGLASKATVKCRGSGVGPDLQFEAEYVNFGVTKPDVIVTRSFKIKNNSAMSAYYQVWNYLTVLELLLTKSEVF